MSTSHLPSYLCHDGALGLRLAGGLDDGHAHEPEELHALLVVLASDFDGALAVLLDGIRIPRFLKSTDERVV